MISDKLKEQLGDWECLYPFFESEEWPKIKEALKPSLSQTTPDVSVWFRAFKECKYKDVKLVIVGLSPYFGVDSYTNENIADGLAFSTSEKHTVPPSLFKIYKGMEWDLWKGMNRSMDRWNDLTFLANQGVLLLNSALTTTYGSPDAHLEIWKPFTIFVLQQILNKNRDIQIVGMGKHANAIIDGIEGMPLLTTYALEHPAAAARANREWEHRHIFSTVNETLKEQNLTPIVWDRYLFRDLPF